MKLGRAVPGSVQPESQYITGGIVYRVMKMKIPSYRTKPLEGTCIDLHQKLGGRHASSGWLPFGAL